MLKKEKIRYEVLHPTYKALYDLVGEDNMMKVYHEFRGTQVQMPMKLYDRQTLKNIWEVSVIRPLVLKICHTFMVFPRDGLERLCLRVRNERNNSRFHCPTYIQRRLIKKVKLKSN
ncbi:hypothetical protein [Companilactobacillus paralimentarius]|uniref:hypothetical protein n=1 Tax=Companilactobacillus paralimentarius TaxID=83526 RepID=UPI001265E298|nr:hypothetical protein [Companilactobacillus paralimentarius]QFR68948.1 hypothetical protein LP238_03295 [Companilactobacillus paralimentarius]